MSTLTRRRSGRFAIGYRLVAVTLLLGWFGWLVQAVPAQAPQPDQTKPAPSQPPSQAQPAPPQPPDAAEPAAPTPKAPAPKAPEPPPAPLRQIKTLAVDPNQETAAVRRAVRDIVKGGTLGDSQKQQLTAYYDGFAFPRWTRPSDYASIPAIRADLAADLRSAASGPVYDFLVGLTIARMKEFIKPEYADVVRYNAMLVIGELNVAERTRPVVPLPEAQTVLLSELNNSSQNAFVEVAVLIGLERHCALGFPDQQVRKQAFDLLLTLAQSQAAPGRSPGGHAWMRAKAIDALGALRYPGSNGAAAVTLANLVRTDDAKIVPPMVRIAAAKALGSLDYQQATGGIKPMDLATALAQMASNACATERKRPPPQALATGPSDFGRVGPRRPKGPSGYAPGMDNLPDDPEHVLQYRRRLKTEIKAVQTGLGNASKGRETGVVALVAGTPDEALVKDLCKVVQELMSKVLDDKETTLYELNKKVDESKGRLDEFLSKARGAGGAGPAPVATPAPKGPPPAKTPPAAGGSNEPAAPAATPPVTPPATP